MRDDFAIFILSHGRAGEQHTLKALEKSGYTGRLYIIVDDLDEQKDEYIKKYGDKVIVFDKTAEAEKTDTVTNTGDLRSVVFARNISYKIAEKLGVKFFGEFDDDINSFLFRYNDCGHLCGKTITDIDSVFESMLEFQEAAGITSLGIASANGFIGGAKGKYRNGMTRDLHQAFILRTDKPIKFIGILNEDGIASTVSNQTGVMVFELCSVCQNTPARASNGGGLSELYKTYDEYIRAFYSIIACPSCLKVFQRGGHVTLKRKKDFEMVKILSEKWKKYA